jgi:hypothetical protein
LDTLGAEQLLLGTALQESHLSHRRQIGGPALGYFQVEPKTHDDVWNNFLKYRPQLAAKVNQLLSSPTANKIKELENNDKYATAIARIIYLRAPAPMPPLNDIPKMAAYWKRYYNTALGKGKEADFVSNWKKYNGGVVP